MIKNLNIDLDCIESKDKYLNSISFCKRGFLRLLNEKFSDLPFDSISLSLIIVSDDEIKEVNSEHRSKNSPTDVLSFPLQENLRAGVFDNISNDLSLGDILISKDTCERQARDNQIDFLDEFIHLLCHGFLHLIGYDHELNEDEDKLMRDLESNLVDSISKIKKGL